MAEDDCFQPVCEKEDPITAMRSRTRRNMSFDDEPQIECPLGRASLGRFTWSFLHTMAIYYPDTPSIAQQETMKGFINGLAEFYPCKHCRTHFQKDVARTPPTVDSRQNLSEWLCHRHNEVNVMLGKQIFDCSFGNLEQRWRTGLAGCASQSKNLE